MWNVLTYFSAVVVAGAVFCLVSDSPMHLIDATSALLGGACLVCNVLLDVTDKTEYQAV